MFTEREVREALSSASGWIVAELDGDGCDDHESVKALLQYTGELTLFRLHVVARERVSSDGGEGTS